MFKSIVMRDLNGMVESLVLVVLTELGGETFILIVLLSQKVNKFLAFLIVYALMLCLLWLYTELGHFYLRQVLSEE